MMLGAFGDSFIFGSDLLDCKSDLLRPSTNTYPALLAKKLHLEYICYAYPGAGNQIILDDILRAIYAHKNKMLYIINWSWIDRYDYVDTNCRYEQWKTLRPGENNYKHNFYYKNFHSEYQDKLFTLTQISTAIQALEKSNCKFVITYMDKLIFDTRWHCPASIRWLQEHCTSHLSDYNGDTFLEWSRSHNFAESKNWHPLEQAHEAAAEYWLPKVRTLLNSSAKEESHAFK